jgi:glycerate-2-kinase
VDQWRGEGITVNVPNPAERIRQASLNPRQLQRQNDLCAAFAASGDLAVTGSTLTNVNGFQAVIIG